jgi:hypothetical protein
MKMRIDRVCWEKKGLFRVKIPYLIEHLQELKWASKRHRRRSAIYKIYNPELAMRSDGSLVPE